jgi:O-6-methylguanine DNA methyltransferase
MTTEGKEKLFKGPGYSRNKQEDNKDDAEVAKSIGSPTSVRAVAGACAANNIAVAIPCHRVVRTDGSHRDTHGGSLASANSLIGRASRNPN